MSLPKSMFSQLPKLKERWQDVKMNWPSKDEYKALPSESAFSRSNVSSPELLRRVLSKTTCPPLRQYHLVDCTDDSLENFQDYLLHKEHSSENLLFWNWYKRYKLQFDNLPNSQRELSPPLSTQNEAQRIPKLKIRGTDRTTGAEVTLGPDFASQSVVNLPMKSLSLGHSRDG